MDEYFAHIAVAFLTPLACGMIIAPIAKRFKKDWKVLLVSSIFFSFLVMVLKELGDQQVSRNDIVSDMAGLFFGTAVLLSFAFMGKSPCSSDRRRSFSAVRYESTGFRPMFAFVRQDISLREVLQAGIRLAHLGARFYSRAANTVSSPASRRLCRNLARMEGRQAARLSAILNEWQPRPMRERVMEDIQLFILRHDLFLGQFNADSSTEDILNYALSCEVKMQRFYRQYREAFPESWKREKLAALIQMEVDHQDMLLGMREDAGVKESGKDRRQMPRGRSHGIVNRGRECIYPRLFHGIK